MASGHGFTTLGRVFRGVVANAGDGVLGDRGVESVRVVREDFIDSEEGVLGSAENRFRLLRVALKGLLDPL